MSKINVLVVPSDRAGSGKFRCVDPHIVLQNNHSDIFNVDIIPKFNFNENEKLKKYNIVFFHRIPQHNYKSAVGIIKKIRSLGIKVVIDFDDDISLDPFHPSYKMTKHLNLDKINIECIKLSDLVVTTTNILANKLKTYNKNVEILPNGIDPTESQFKSNPSDSDRLRFGWLGGSTHMRDIELLRNACISLSQNNKLDSQLVLCGFNVDGKQSVIDKKTGEVSERKMKPEETVWFVYELFLTNNYRSLVGDSEYLSYLSKFKFNDNFNDKDKFYRRIWSQPIDKYGYLYNEFDVSLVPLKDNTFNKFKSQLKIIEAGFHKKAVIAQNFGPYQIDLINMYEQGGSLNKNGNCLLVEPRKNHKQWFQHMKRLLNNKSLVSDLGEKLYETVKDTYDLNNITKKRAEIYSHLNNK